MRQFNFQHRTATITVWGSGVALRVRWPDDSEAFVQGDEARSYYDALIDGDDAAADAAIDELATIAE